MYGVTKPHPPKNRKDHYLPVGYLKGFIDPVASKRVRPLWCWDVHKARWEPKSPKQIGYQVGMYDFAADVPDAEHADETFRPFENRYPALRDELVRTSFASWNDHIGELCAYMQMIRARSPLYFVEKSRELATTRVHMITAVEPTADGQHKVTLDSMEGRLMTAAERRNHALSLMRAEVKRGVDWMGEFHWTLRTTDDPQDPVTTGEQPLTVRADWTMKKPLERPDTFIFFPLCWQACMVGCRVPFQRDVEPFASDKLRAYRGLVRGGAREFIVSPQRVDD